jgi:hypothetical protein
VLILIENEKPSQTHGRDGFRSVCSENNSLFQLCLQNVIINQLFGYQPKGYAKTVGQYVGPQKSETKYQATQSGVSDGINPWGMIEL